MRSLTIKGGRVLGPAPFFIMGVVNVTPDSFYDGGRYLDPDRAVEQAVSLARQGAVILDVGGESSRPFSDPVGEEEERRRVLPVVEALARALEQEAGPPAISVDTYKAAIAAETLEAGADIINDISACSFDPGLLDVLVQFRPGYVLMHSQGRPKHMQEAPEYDNVVEDVRRFFATHLDRLARAGFPTERVILDPGIGFGKTLAHNLELLSGVETFLDFGCEVLIGLSNKSMWQMLLGLEKDERGAATQIGTALAAYKGASLHRVHDVAAAAQALTIAGAFKGLAANFGDGRTT